MMTEKQETCSIPFDQLTPHQPRTFLPAKIDLTKPESVTGWMERLLGWEIYNEDDLEQFLLDRSEMEAAISQQQSILYIQMTCRTDDAATAEAYKNFIEQVAAATKPYTDRLDRKYIEAAEKFKLEPKRYGVYLRGIRADIELFRPENIPLQTEEELLSQQYQAVTGAMTVPFEGKEYTMPHMRKFLNEPQRDIRQRAWQATAQRFAADQEPLDAIFDRMISLRGKIAQNADHNNYRDYKFKEYHRFDYGVEDCRRFHQAVKSVLVPLQRQILEQRAAQMNLPRLRPWDLDADPLGQPPLKPFETIDEFTRGIAAMFERVDPEFASQFTMMRQMGLLDLESRKGKAPGGYQSTLNEARKPFIFMNAVGSNDDLRVLMHEGGHAFHVLACAHDPLLAYRHAPMEFAEVASMSMELLAAEHLDIFYNEHDIQRWWRQQIETVVRILTSVAANDAFQHWLYENPQHSRQERNEQWIALNTEYGTDMVDWSGLEAFRATAWQRILHFYQVPFYYIEYGIAQLGALGIWRQSRIDYRDAVSRYKQALSLGGSRGLAELFQSAGLVFDFSEKTIEPIGQLLQTQWMDTIER